MQISYIILALVALLLGGAGYLFIDGLALIRRANGKRYSDIVSDYRAAEADARPFEVVNQQLTAPVEQVAVEVQSQANIAPESKTEPSPSEVAQESMIPTTAAEWRKYDDPACLRRPGNFVLA